MVLVQKELSNAYIGEILPTSITLDLSSIGLTTAGQTVQLTATVEPNEAPRKTVTWSSDDTTVATVDSTGLVTCVTPGNCTITATTVNGLTATCSVNQGWSPGVHTYAYYPLTANANDVVNSRNMTADARITYSVANGAYFPYASSSANRHTGMLNPIGVTSSGTWTFSWWQNTERIQQSDARGIDLYWSNGRIYTAWSSGSQQIALNGASASVVESANTWYHHVITISNGVIKGYVDGDWKKDGSVNTGQTTSYFRWGQEFNNAYPRQLVGYLKDIIIEDVARSGTDVSNYFNLTKGDYGK